MKFKGKIRGALGFSEKKSHKSDFGCKEHFPRGFKVSDRFASYCGESKADLAQWPDLRPLTFTAPKSGHFIFWLHM